MLAVKLLIEVDVCRPEALAHETVGLREMRLRMPGQRTDAYP
jgi:hypothetical protein